MTPAIVVLVAMLATSVTLVVVLSIAWSSFGRPRHAVSWAAAYMLAAAEWAMNLPLRFGWLDAVVARPVILGLGIVSAALVTLGFRQRARLYPRLWLLGGVTAAALLCAGWTSIAVRDDVIDRAVLLLFMALMKVLAATTLVGRGWTSNTAERAMFVVLMIFTVYYTALAAIGLAMPTGWERDVFATLLLLGTPTAFIVTGLFVVFLLAADLAEDMRRLAILDPLTNVLNRRGLSQAADTAIANSRRTGQPLSVVLADLDRFKQINDTSGHAAGDRALSRFAGHVEQSIRKGDLFGRIGGEEFALVVVNAGADTAVEVAERIRVGLAGLDVGMDGYRLTCSFGVAELAGDGDFAALLDRADAALYRSKQRGRDRVTLAGAVEEAPASFAPVAAGGRQQ